MILYLLPLLFLAKKKPSVGFAYNKAFKLASGAADYLRNKPKMAQLNKLVKRALIAEPDSEELLILEDQIDVLAYEIVLNYMKVYNQLYNSNTTFTGLDMMEAREHLVDYVIKLQS